MLRPFRLLVAATVLLLTAFGLFSSVAATPEPGIGLADDESVVSDVIPGSPVWQDGIRAGDRVLELRDASEPGGWSMVVEHGAANLGTSASRQLSRLRSTAPVGLLAMTLAAASLVLLLRRTLLGLALIPIALALAAIPLAATGTVRDSLFGGPAALVVAGLSVGLIPGTRVRAVGPVLAGTALGVLLLLAILGRSAWFGPLDAARAPSALVLALWGLGLAVDRRRVAERLLSPDSPIGFDVIFIPIVLAALAAGVLFAGVPIAVAAVLAVVAVAIYPSTRRLTAKLFERLILGTMRREAEIRAAEEERGRLAREIHDAPLQALAAVIRRLDSVPAVEGEVTALREVAGQLRDVATSLHPPVLEDLGLVPALSDLQETLLAGESDAAVRVEVDDLTTAQSRPDRVVEIAAYRIVREAATNALRHSGGREVSIAGTVTASSIELTVTDDGSGVDRAAVNRARRAGHFGMDSMRERADAIGGELVVSSSSQGTLVRFTWEKPT